MHCGKNGLCFFFIRNLLFIQFRPQRGKIQFRSSEFWFTNSFDNFSMTYSFPCTFAYVCPYPLIYFQMNIDSLNIFFSLKLLSFNVVKMRDYHTGCGKKRTTILVCLRNSPLYSRDYMKHTLSSFLWGMEWPVMAFCEQMGGRRWLTLDTNIQETIQDA